MTDLTRGHARYDELAAGYAVHALDPADNAEFLAHLPSCPRCQAALSDFTEVTAALGDNWLAAEASPQLGERIMAAVADDLAANPGNVGASNGGSANGGSDGVVSDDRGSDGQRGQPTAAVTDLADRRRRYRRRTIVGAAAAAAVLAAGGAIWGGLAAGSGHTPAGPTAGCVQAGSCREVVLTDASSHRLAAKVIVSDGKAWLIPSSLPADNTADQIYVLWQITGAHTPLAVGSFDIARHGGKPMLIGNLAVPYRGTWAFAVSIEHGRTIPATPSHPVALGQVLS